jgi:hypothetical protein
VSDLLDFEAPQPLPAQHGLIARRSNINKDYPQDFANLRKEHTPGSKTFLGTEKNWFMPATKELPRLSLAGSLLWGSCADAGCSRGWGDPAD